MTAMTEELTTAPTPTMFRFPDRLTALAALDAAGLVQFVPASHDHALDVIGTITTGGEYDAETGDVITEPVTLDGWHVNYLGDVPEEWLQYAVAPENPVRVWA